LSACTFSIHSLEPQLRIASVAQGLIPTLSPFHQQTWLQIPRLGPYSEFSRNDYCLLKLWELTWFLLQPVTIRPSAMQETRNQLCCCETFDLRQDSRLLKWELCKLVVMQWAGGPLREQIRSQFWCASTKPYHLSTPAEVLGHFSAELMFQRGENTNSVVRRPSSVSPCSPQHLVTHL
jgi:hypothetical protein